MHQKSGYLTVHVYRGWGVTILVKILHSVEGGDVEQGCSNLETILPCLRLLISLSHTLVFIYLTYLYYLSLYILDIFMLNLYMLGLFAHTCIQPREP